MSIDTTLGHADLFEQASELCCRDPNLLVIGSVGRAAIMGAPLEPYRPSGLRRDIDVMRMGERTGRITSPLVDSDIDALFENWIGEDGSYLVFPHDRSVYVPVPHPEIFAPYHCRVGDALISTPHPDVLGKINIMQYIQRPKDRESAAVYAAFLDTLPVHLDNKLLEPFDALRSVLAMRKAYRAAAAARYIYQLSVPEKIRRDLKIGSRIGWLRAEPDRE